ncbi:MAG: hypothetical protein IPG45_07830 [Deltaproteobacteria bacterium]|nr:hypothetical protein [Deltaproteobacteria bacterium]
MRKHLSPSNFWSAPELRLRSEGGQALGDGASGLAVEAGLAVPRGTIFGYGLRLRAAEDGRGQELTGLLEARVTVGLPEATVLPLPVLRGGFRLGRRQEGQEERLLLGPHLTAGLAFTLPGGLVLELGVGGYGEILPFALSLGGQLLLRAGTTE